MKELIGKIEDIFWVEGDELGICNVEHHEINLTDEESVYVKQFPLPPKLRDIAIDEVRKLISSELIKTSKSAFNAPTWVVKKKS